MRQTCHSSVGGTIASCAAIWNTLSADVYTISLPVRMCSTPSSSIICVPDAALLPITPMPVSRSNASISSCGKPFGNVGKGSFSVSPAISQWPEVVSLPAAHSVIVP